MNPHEDERRFRQNQAYRAQMEPLLIRSGQLLERWLGCRDGAEKRRLQGEMNEIERRIREAGEMTGVVRRKVVGSSHTMPLAGVDPRGFTR